MSSLQLYRVNALVGGDIRILRTTGWSNLDALDRVAKRLHAEGHQLFTLNVLDRKDIL